jgi:peptidoglycan/LPS O-acetylase OafA/YrhL
VQRIPPFKTLDFFRGFAAIWVVMYHSTDRWLTDPNSAFLHVPLYAFTIRGQLGVMIFFVISGYCITAAAYSALVSGKSVWRYSYERARRIYPPYLGALLLTVLSLAIIGYANSHHMVTVNHLQTLTTDPTYWFANVFLLQYELGTPMINIVFWSLGYEVAFYFIIGLFLLGAKWITTRRNLYTGTLFFVCAVGVSTMLTLIGVLLYGKPFFPFDAWHQFSIGALLFFLLELKPATLENYTQGFRRIVLANVLIVTALTIVFASIVQIDVSTFAHPSTKLRALTCLVFAAILIGLRQIDDALSSHISLRPFMWVGTFSYSLYLIHPIVIPYADILSRKAGFDGSRYWITIFSQLIVALVFGRIFYLFLEKHFVSKRQIQRLSAEHFSS